MVIEGGCLLLLPAVAVRNSYMLFMPDKCIMTFKALSPLKPLLFATLE